MPREPSTRWALLEELAALRCQVAELQQRVGELTREEQAVEREKERLFTVLLNMPVMIDAFDADWNIVLWNRECERVTGYSAAEIIGNPKALELLYPKRAYRERMMREWKERADDYRDWHWEITAKDGGAKSVAWYNISARVPIAPWRTWGIGVEITEQKKAERALRESEERFRSLFENAADGFVVADVCTGEFRMANKALCDMTGYAPREIIQLGVQDIHPEDSLPHALDTFARQARGELRLATNIPVKTKDGRTVYADINAIPISLGGTACVMGAFRDVTEYRRLIGLLQESEERYRVLVESAGEAIAMVDGGGVFLFMNMTAAHRLGGEPKDYIGKTMWDLFPKVIADRQVDSVREVIRAGGGMNAIGLTEVQGQQRWYNTTLEPIKDRTGRIVAALIVGRDIQELKQAQDELEDYRQKLHRAEQLASIGALSARVAHELNQPLTVCRLSLQEADSLVKEAGCSTTAAEALQEALEGLSDVISRVDQFRRLARQSSTEEPKVVELLPVVSRAVGLFEDKARAKRVGIRVEGIDALPAVCVTRSDVEQVCSVLIDNAIQAADSRKDRMLTIRGETVDSRIVLRFEDDCGGIPVEHVDQVFQLFFTTKPSGEGMGMGLWIVDQIVSKAGGKVLLENRVGEGSTFVINLPM